MPNASLLMLWCSGAIVGFGASELLHYLLWRRTMRSIGELGHGLSRIATAQTVRDRLGVRRR